MNERFVFMPSLGFILLVVIIWLEQINKRNMSLQTNAGIFIIVCCLFSYKTFSRNFAWKNNHILFETDVQTSSNSAKITTALAADYLELVDSTTDENEKRERCQKSLDMVNQAIDIYPENSGAYLLKGNAIFKRNQNYDSAILCFKLALYYRPKDYFDGNFNLAATYMNQKKYDSSLIYSKEAFRINSNHSASGNILAFSYLMNGQLEDAEKIFNQVAIIEKKEVFKSEISKWIYYADHLKDAGNYDKAFEFYNSILAKEPENADANYGKGIILGKVMNQLANSIPFLEKAVRLDDTKIAWKEDLAVAYGFSKQYAKTISLLESVIKAEPNYANAYQNLAASYANLGNKEKSIYYAELAKTKVPK